jgi:AcrR family transcriptional regulator
MINKELVRDSIIETSRQIFGQHGFKNTTMEDIAHEINKGKSSIYYYFKCKEEIYKAVIEKEACLIKNEVDEALEKSETASEKLRSYISVRLRMFLQASSFYEAVRNEYLSHLDFVDKTRKKYDYDEKLQVQQLLKEGVESGDFIAINPSLAAEAIISTIRGIEVPLLKITEPDMTEECIQNLISILFNGILKR